MEFDERVDLSFDEVKSQITSTLQEIKDKKAEIYSLDETKMLVKQDDGAKYEDKIS